MSWWDYGYQISAMANRTILVDNNTWNNTHISRVGQAMASSEDKAYEIMRELDVDYVLVIFGGLTGYSSDGILTFHSIPSIQTLTLLLNFQISTSSYGWFELVVALIEVNTSRKTTITLLLENSELIRKVPQLC